MAIHRIVTISNFFLQSQRSSCVLIQKNVRINNFRCLSVDKPRHTKALKTEKEKLRTYFVQKYVVFVNNYTNVLEKRFPRAVNMYRVFSIGIKDFLLDLKKYITLRIQVAKDKGFSKMSRQEIELYQKMPADMWRIAPVLILSAIPFGNYIIFPLAFLKPKTLLCSHFWSIQQRAEFSTQDLRDRLRHNKPVFRALQAKLDTMPVSDVRTRWKRILALLGSGVHPTPDDVLSCRDVFSKEPYDLNCLTYAHMGHLLKMHGLRKTIFRKNKLKYCAFILLEMDKAIMREGGVNKLDTESLRYACHIRGLHSSHLTNQEMRDWLQKWLKISLDVDKATYSMILHCPIFFGYNHPQNWVLIY